LKYSREAGELCVNTAYSNGEMNMSKGMDAERELCAILWDKHQMATLRAPASGSIDRPSPDVVALKGLLGGVGMASSLSFAIELKANKDGTAHFDEHEIEELEQWADRAGAEAYVIVKPDLRTFDSWLVYHTSELNTTEQGYSIGKRDHDKAKTLSEVFG